MARNLDVVTRHSQGTQAQLSLPAFDCDALFDSAFHADERHSNLHAVTILSATPVESTRVELCLAGQ